ncbi:MAG: LytTR family transcriptional regulator DNA-binding domain-containing protein [Paludibacteraceae bacterium]|nr:LytTR family transcriptional regulator DNA-binding domain-containing protein [Paludibacteraceae bacterium]
MDTTHLVLEFQSDLYRIPIMSIIYIKADGNYSNIYLHGNENIYVTRQLGKIADDIRSQLGENGSNFVLVGKSLIINYNYIFRINVPEQQLKLMDKFYSIYTIEASKEALKNLKAAVSEKTKE